MKLRNRLLAVLLPMFIGSCKKDSAPELGSKEQQEKSQPLTALPASSGKSESVLDEADPVAVVTRMPDDVVAQKETLRGEIGSLVSAQMVADVDALTTFTNPNVIAAVGGEQKFIEQNAASIGSLEPAGIRFGAVEVGNDFDYFESQSHQFILVPAKTTMTFADQTQTLEAHQLGVRPKSGGGWTYIDTSAYKLDRIREWYEDFPPSKTIPKPVVSQ